MNLRNATALNNVYGFRASAFGPTPTNLN